jgi:hypothetical protein
MALEFVDDMARGSRWWDGVGHYDVDGDVNIYEEPKEMLSRQEAEVPASDAPGGSLDSDTSEVDVPTSPVRSVKQAHSVGITDVRLAILL